jgi:GNAT superfamily N-acetyltransferase
MLQIVSDIGYINNWVEEHFKSSTLTNNYLMASEFNRLREARQLYVYQYSSNLLLFVQLFDFYRVYYYLNDLNAPPNISIKEPLVMEILYRVKEKIPGLVVDYWATYGFKKHLIRDNMVAKIEQINLQPEPANEKVRFAVINDSAFVQEQIHAYLDYYTGDQMSYDEIKNSITEKNLLIAEAGNKPAGFLHFDVQNGVAWLRHITVDQNFRGIGVSKSLVNKYIADNSKEGISRYQLWVIDDNKSAVNLYLKYGFTYNYKSTISLLKK